jgi:hypothetical protein
MRLIVSARLLVSARSIVRVSSLSCLDWVSSSSVVSGLQKISTIVVCDSGLLEVVLRAVFLILVLFLVGSKSHAPTENVCGTVSIVGGRLDDVCVRASDRAPFEFRVARAALRAACFSSSPIKVRIVVDTVLIATTASVINVLAGCLWP